MFACRYNKINLYLFIRFYEIFFFIKKKNFYFITSREFTIKIKYTGRHKNLASLKKKKKNSATYIKLFNTF